ncbi:hypothetical protein [Aquabacterium sp. CECT 9606]|uniref:hypothetical protein n=1 Tax=Aquabacterium sp. CECT 9606 TaxID=2845822 RepID=UPI001E43429A|nr:hypothetical protein [Aquabacterium sp. CECT 9606]
MNTASSDGYNVKEISYGVHRCDDRSIFEYEQNGQEFTFSIEYEAQLLVEKGHAPYRARLPGIFKDDSVSNELIHWRILAARNMAQYFRTTWPWNEKDINLNDLDSFDGHRPSSIFW